MQQPASDKPGTEEIFEQAIGLFVAGRAAEAEPLCRRVLTAQPQNPHALHMLGLMRGQAGARDEALALIGQSLATGVRHPAIEFSYARLLVEAGRNAEAVAPLQRSLQLDPRQPPVIALLANVLVAVDRVAEARQYLDSALAVSPDDPQLLTASGIVHRSLGAYDEAMRDLRRALAADPGSAEAHANVAAFYEHSNRLEEAQQLLDTAARRGCRHASLVLLGARLRRRKDDIAGAQALLLELQRQDDLSPTQRRDLQFELAWCADSLGDVPAAMSYFQAGNELALEIAAPSPEFLRDFPQQLAALAHFYRQAGPVEAAPPLAAAPAFLVGFPRSGTTLLDTMLGAHPGIVVMEEKPGIQATLDAYIGSGLKYPDDLERLTPEQCFELRTVHARVCRANGWDGARRLLDKSPFATAHLGLLDRVFPGAPVIFMLRHPCDVVLSCFTSGFEIHPGTVHFTRLESTVETYCGIMDLWQIYLERLPLRHHLLRYEDLVDGPETQMRSLLEFLGLPWEPRVLAHREAALKRGFISTPSYNQVSQPIYTKARGRWRRYAAYLEPHLPRLMPYIRAFGYDI